MTQLCTSYLQLIGSYAKETEPSIHSVRYIPPTVGESQNLDSTLQVIHSVSQIVNPSYVTLHPTLPRVYVASEQLDDSGSLAVYELDPTHGTLTYRHSQTIADASPCFVTVDATGRYLLSANYLGGSITLCTLDEDGGISSKVQEIFHTGFGPRSDRQESAHPHAITFDAHNRFALVTDLGTDEMVIYQLDTIKSQLTRIHAYHFTPGSGPRLFLFHPNNNEIGYAICELNNTIVAFHYEPADGSLQPTQTVSTLPEDWSPTVETPHVEINTASHLAFSPDARFLYASNRGHDSLVVFAIEQTGGSLRAIQWISTEGHTPRHFAITKDGLSLFVANQDTNSVVVFAIDKTTGLLHATGTHLTVASPSCVTIVQ